MPVRLLAVIMPLAARIVLAASSYAGGAVAKASKPQHVEKDWPLAGLLLDQRNPRFGLVSRAEVSQEDILDRIVERFGVEDVLSSLAVNGYFSAEPMVCKPGPTPDKLVVAEGNRRLAACLILAGDPRASRQSRRAHVYRQKWEEAGRPRIDPVPIILFDGSDAEGKLLSYLGVRHISSSQPWDSYAKATWVAQVVEHQQLDVAAVAAMIGDEHQTIKRLLEGYYLVKQAVEAGVFRPEDSNRRGRGSVTEYPFSWVYTILGYSAVRRFLGLQDDRGPAPNPVPSAKLSDTGLVLRAMFGDKAKGRNAAVEDSRELGDLAGVVGDPEKVDMLNQGVAVSDILRQTKPIESRLREGLAEVRTIQSELSSGITATPPAQLVADSLVEAASRNQRLAAEITEKLRKAAGRDGG